MDLGKLGARIKEMREKRRFRQSDIASALRLSSQAISKWERGENAPDIAVLVQLSQLLGVSIEWILGGTEAEPGTFLATVFSTSLMGYAERATTSSPAELAASANAIHYAVTEAVLRHDGVPVKCVGDGLLAFFSGANQSTRAVDAAKGAKAALGRPELVVVMHHGPIFLGSVGHPEYARTDIIGATVNTAFLLAPYVVTQCASHVGMTKAVADGLPPELPVRARGRATVLGQKEPVEMFELG